MSIYHPGLSLDIPIFTKTYELYKTFYGYLPAFPKKDRYTLGQKCELVLLDLLEAIILAGNLSKQEKLPILKQASLKVDILKVLFRLGKDLKIVDNKKYLVFEGYLQEIGKMLGGWIKTTAAPQNS
ncbi:MAG: diversity-generating retroelement protein Avd [Patescibacteria group bacterium]